MIKDTINADSLRFKFAQSGAKKIGTGICTTKFAAHDIILDKFSLLASGLTTDNKQNNKLNNVIPFKKPKKVA